MGFLKRIVVGVIVSVAFVMVFGVASAFAGSAWWGLTSDSWPTNLPENGTGKVIVTVENLGDVSVDGGVTPVVVEDVLPEHLEVIAVEGVAGESTQSVYNRGPVSCSSPTSHEARCVFKGVLPSYEEIEVRITVKTTEASSSEENSVSVSGGGASLATLTRPIRVGASNEFGVADYELIPEEEAGAVSTQAGVHPFQLTTVLTLDTSEVASVAFYQEPAGGAKDLTFQVPPGLIGNPTPLPQCTDAQFTAKEEGTEHNECEAKTAVGAVTVTYDALGAQGFTSTRVPVFNLTPLVGEPARFGFEVAHVRAYLDTAVRSGSDYGVTVTVANIPQLAGFMGSKLTFWGVPGDPAHDGSRGWDCIDGTLSACSANVAKPSPFLSMPTFCAGPLRTTVQTDSWEEPHPSPTQLLEAPLFDEYELRGMDSCNKLQFNPEISVVPDVPNASSATGLNVQVHVPQTAALNPEGLSESALRNTTVTLPEGVAVNPGGADGLEACSTDQIGYSGKEQSEPDTNLFTPVLGSPFCPDGSKIGTLEIETPLLPRSLKGAVYLAAQNANPFGSLVAVYLVAEDPVSGFILKLAGEVALREGTGQLVAAFKNTPPLPFENLRLHFFGESRAPLGTPPLCGSHTTQAVFAPWSGNKPSNVSSTFDITSGPNGGPCPGSALPFAPSLTAGMTSNQAGGFSPFTMTMSREDGNQNLKSITLHMPPGLSGTLSGFALCGEAQADAGTCGPESLIGETTVSVGLGGNPFTVTGGKVYLTGPYESAPFGLSIVNPAEAGPFDLGKVVVRAKIEVDPHTAELTITSDSKGPYAIPPMIKGIPLQIQHVNVTVNRPGFTFNPTSCNPLQIKGTLSSIEGATSELPVAFQAANCATLQFAPKFKVATNGKTSKANGASLNVKLAYPNTPQGTQANIASVKVELPKQLPSRLTTLQKACTATQFETNPAGCPAASIIGHARATTPILPVPLEGPAYFVSHGGEAFPSLIIRLEGYGVTVDLVGTTFISKTGITSSTFKTVPDVPVGTFELTLPQGPYSALTANGNLCTSKKLTMPTEFVAQNGMVLHQKTLIGVTGCPKIAKLTRAQKLAKALKACRKNKVRSRRVACERLARKHYGPAKKAKKGAVHKKQ